VNKTFPKVTLITLNWNSWRDTIECLESVLKINYPNFNVILVDNNSQDGSFEQIISWAEGKSLEEIESFFPHLVKPYITKPISYKICEISNGYLNCQNCVEGIGKIKIYILKSNKNLGFAVANNVAIKFLQEQLLGNYYFLLNNDTVVEPNVLDHLVSTMEQNPNIGVAQSTIYKYEQPDSIANAGAKIYFWGQTKYYKNINKHTIKTVDFVNGCAMFIRSKIITELGALSENFFFGEEDFEFSMRLKKKGIKKVCVGDSIVYHKVGVSSKMYIKNKQNRKFLIFTLNRIVDMKSFYPLGIWHIWRFFTVIYFYYLAIFHLKNSCWIALKIIYEIYRYTNQLNDVKKETIEPILSKFEY